MSELTEEQKLYKGIIDKTKEKLKKLNDNLEKEKNVLAALKHNCPHVYSYSGRTSHEDQYTCEICGNMDYY